MTAFKAADRVHVHVDYDGVVSYREENGDIWVTPDGHTAPRRVSAESVTLLDPPGWPPQQGDLWASDHHEYYARKVYSTAGGMGSEVRMVCDVASPDDVSAGMFRALNPRLIRRRTERS